jgi:hypothetical protein
MGGVVSFVRQGTALRTGILKACGNFSTPIVTAAQECSKQGIPYIYFPHGCLEPWAVFRQGWWKALKKTVYWYLRERKVADHALSVFYTAEREKRLAATMKLFEYLAAGLPVLGSRSEGTEDVVLGWKCGVVVTATDPAEIAGAIIRLNKSPELLACMSRNARHAARQSFNWPLEERKLVGLFFRTEQRGSASRGAAFLTARPAQPGQPRVPGS